MQIISRGSKLWQLSTCSVIAFLKYIQVSTVPLSLNLTLARVCRCSRSQILPGNSRVTRERTIIDPRDESYARKVHSREGYPARELSHVTCAC